MIVILFRSKLTSVAGDDYAKMNNFLSEYVQDRPGFIAAKSFRAEDGERLTLVWWRDRETLEQWRTDMNHVAAKKQGRERWYEYYKIEIAEVYRESSFERKPEATTAAAANAD